MLDFTWDINFTEIMWNSLFSLINIPFVIALAIGVFFPRIAKWLLVIVAAIFVGKVIFGNGFF